MEVKPKKYMQKKERPGQRTVRWGQPEFDLCSYGKALETTCSRKGFVLTFFTIIQLRALSLSHSNTVNTNRRKDELRLSLIAGGMIIYINALGVLYVENALQR